MRSSETPIVSTLRTWVRERYRSKRVSALRSAIAATENVRIIVGSSGLTQPGWISTDVDVLDLLAQKDWDAALGARKVDAILAEHVWEHLSLEDGKRAFRHCYDQLKPGGYLRIAVPDGRFPDPEYLNEVRPGGVGPGADDHRVLYDFDLLRSCMEEAGFEVRPLEYFDENGQFFEADWDPAQGRIERSKRFDERNAGGVVRYTSIVVDGVKRR